jgi:hypothetical protein
MKFSAVSAFILFAKFTGEFLCIVPKIKKEPIFSIDGTTVGA